MLFNKSPLKNTSKKLKSPQTSIKSLKIERKKDFKSFLNYVKKESKAIEDIKIPSLKEEKNKKTSLIGSILGLGSLGLLAFLGGFGDEKGDPDDQPNKFDFFDPEAFKRTLATQSRIANLSLTGMKASQFFDDGGGKEETKKGFFPFGPTSLGFKSEQYFENENQVDFSKSSSMLGFRKEFDLGANKIVPRKKINVLDEALSEVDFDIFGGKKTKEEIRFERFRKRLFPKVKNREFAKIVNGDIEIDYSTIGEGSGTNTFKNKNESMKTLKRIFNTQELKSKKIADPFSFDRLVDSDEFKSNLGNKAKQDAAKDALLDEIYKKPPKNRFQRFLDSGAGKVARLGLGTIKTFSKFLQIEPIVSGIFEAKAVKGSMTAEMDVFGRLPGDPNFDKNSKGIYSDYIDVTHPRAIKEMRQIKINYLTSMMMTGRMKTPDISGLNLSNFELPSVNFQPPIDGNSDNVVPFDFSNKSIIPNIELQMINSAILQELEKY